MAAQELDDPRGRCVVLRAEVSVEPAVVPADGLHHSGGVAGIAKALREGDRLGVCRRSPLGVEDQKRRMQRVVADVMPGRDFLDILPGAEDHPIEIQFRFRQQLRQVVHRGVERDYAPHRGQIDPRPLKERPVGAEQGDEMGTSGMTDQEEPMRVAAELCGVAHQPPGRIRSALRHLRDRRIWTQPIVGARVHEPFRHEGERLQEGLLLVASRPAAAVQIEHDGNPLLGPRLRRGVEIEAPSLCIDTRHLAIDDIVPNLDPGGIEPSYGQGRSRPVPIHHDSNVRPMALRARPCGRVGNSLSELLAYGFVCADRLG